MVVGLTGGIGSGKSTVISFFKKKSNIAIYIADDEAKKLMHSPKIKPKLIALFGSNAFLNDKLNRSYIADIVFKDKQKLIELNTIVHPVVRNHFSDFVKQNSEKSYILYENAILFENKNEAICDVIICVTAPLSLRIERLQNRDNTSKDKITDRMKNQWKEVKKTLQSNYIISNIYLNEVEREVNRIHNILTQNIG